MAKPSYSFDNITFTTLPGAYRFGGRPRTVEDVNISLESDSGVEFNYNLFTLQIRELVFRVTDTELDAFGTLHVATSHGTIPFWFSISGIGSGDSILVRKEAGFDPAEIDSPAGGLIAEAMYDYVLKLRSALT